MSTPPPPPGSGDRPWNQGAGDVHPQQGGYPHPPPQSGYPYPPQSGYPYPPQGGPPSYDGYGTVAAGDPLVATSFTDWWSKIIAVLSRSWQPLLVIQLACVVPGIIVSSLVSGAAGDPSTTLDVGAAVVGIVASLVLFVVALLAQGASIYVVGKQAAGRHDVGAGDALRFATARVLPLLGWAVVAAVMLTVGFLLLVLPGLYLLVVFGAALTGVIMFERAGIGRTFALVNPAFGQTAGRLLSFLVAAFVYLMVAGFVARALAGPQGFVHDVLSNLLSLPVSFASVGVAVVTYASLRNRENPAVTTPVLAAELDRP